MGKKILVLKQNVKNPELIVVPDALKLVDIEDAHSPHFGFLKTYETIKSQLFRFSNRGGG